MRRALTVLVMLLAATACSSGSSHKTTPTTVPPMQDLRGQKVVVVDADNNEFTPASILINAGTTVTFKNTDTVAHNVQPFDPSVNYGAKFGVLSGKFGPGASYSFTFNKPGAYGYTCTIHSFMNGSVKVVARAASGSVTTSTAVG
jgi:plastocyanin